MLPPVPPWSAIHPLLVHFPIALHLTAPLLVILALAWRSQVRPLSVAALLVMVLGTAGAWLAVASGEAGAEVAARTPAIDAAIERHEELAEATAITFSILTALFAVAVAALLWARRPLPTRAVSIGFLVFLAAQAGGAILLVNTAHHGGLLVHQEGVRAQISGAMPAAPGAQGEDEHD